MALDVSPVRITCTVTVPVTSSTLAAVAVKPMLRRRLIAPGVAVAPAGVTTLRRGSGAYGSGKFGVSISPQYQGPLLLGVLLPSRREITSGATREKFPVGS